MPGVGWGTVGSSGFGNAAAALACHSVGYPNVTVARAITLATDPQWAGYGTLPYVARVGPLLSHALLLSDAPGAREATGPPETEIRGSVTPTFVRVTGPLLVTVKA